MDNVQNCDSCINVPSSQTNRYIRLPVTLKNKIWSCIYVHWWSHRKVWILVFSPCYGPGAQSTGVLHKYSTAVIWADIEAKLNADWHKKPHALCYCSVVRMFEYSFWWGFARQELEGGKGYAWTGVAIRSGRQTFHAATVIGRTPSLPSLHVFPITRLVTSQNRTWITFQFKLMLLIDQGPQVYGRFPGLEAPTTVYAMDCIFRNIQQCIPFISLDDSTLYSQLENTFSNKPEWFLLPHAPSLIFSFLDIADGGHISFPNVP
jgi:hypothetical protein